MFYWFIVWIFCSGRKLDAFHQQGPWWLYCFKWLARVMAEAFDAFHQHGPWRLYRFKWLARVMAEAFDAFHQHGPWRLYYFKWLARVMAEAFDAFHQHGPWRLYHIKWLARAMAEALQCEAGNSVWWGGRCTRTQWSIRGSRGVGRTKNRLSRYSAGTVVRQQLANTRWR